MMNREMESVSHLFIRRCCIYSVVEATHIYQRLVELKAKVEVKGDINLIEDTKK